MDKFPVCRRKKLSRQEEVVNPFEVHMMMSDMNATAHTFLPSNHSQSSDHERLHLMPDLVGYDHQGGGFSSCLAFIWVVNRV